MTNKASFHIAYALPPFCRGGRNRIGRREKWPKQSWEEGEIGGKSREEGEKKELNFREEEEISSESREKGDLPPCSTPLIVNHRMNSVNDTTGELKITPEEMLTQERM